MAAKSTCRVLIFIFLIVISAKKAEAQGVIVDHAALPLFEQIPEQYLTAAANMTMMFVNRSVGANINDGLTCLGYPSDEAALTSCKRYVHLVPQFSSPASEVNWSRPGGYNRVNWTYYGWPETGIPPELPCGPRTTSGWSALAECFIRYVDANPTRYQVYSYMNSYLEVDGSNDIASPTTGYFANQASRYDIADLEALEARHPGKIFLRHTTSLARGIGSQAATDFNSRMRDYARTSNKFLLDVADIESHDPSGAPCYDNRDGVPYTAGGASENYPNDGLNFLAICQHYTRESNGGHLGNPDVGKIRLAKAFWILMARAAGWNPGAAVNGPPVANAQSVTTAEDTAKAITLTGSDPDGDPLTFRVATQPSHGTLTGTGSNVTYTPAANYYGADSVNFVANDGQIDSTARTVTLSVTAVADPPVAQDDADATEVDTPVVVQVLINDVDADGDTLTISAVGSPDTGTVTNNGTTITYTPGLGFSGSSTFSYTITDGTGGSSTAQVAVTIAQASGSVYALRFDGVSDFVSLQQTAQMMAPGWQSTKTVELWVKPTGSSSCGVPNPISCDAVFGDRPRWWGISRGVVNGADRLWIWNTNSSGSPSAIGIAYAPGEWTHIALVHSGGTLSAYRNGALVGSVPSGATGQPSNGMIPVLQLGGVITGATRNQTFQGEIDEVRLWNTARTAQEISQNMDLLLQGTEYGLAAYYQMSDGIGTSLTDDTGHGFAGTLQDGGSGVPADGPILWVSP